MVMNVIDPFNLTCPECDRSGLCWCQMKNWRSPERRRCLACCKREEERKQVIRPVLFCAKCGAAFTSAVAHARYCSKSCQQAAYRERKLAG